MVQAKGTAQQYIERLDRNIRVALEAGAMLVEDRAQEYAPMDTRTMERSVTHSAVRHEGDRYRVLVGPGPEAPYAPYTELEQYLTTPKGRRKQLGPRSQAKGTARMPWLAPALKDCEDEVRELVRRAVVQA